MVDSVVDSVATAASTVLSVSRDLLSVQGGPPPSVPH